MAAALWRCGDSRVDGYFLFFFFFFLFFLSMKRSLWHERWEKFFHQLREATGKSLGRQTLTKTKTTTYGHREKEREYRIIIKIEHVKE